MIIELKAVSLSKQKIIQDRGVSLELDEKYIRYDLHFTAEEPTNEEDLDLPWEEALTDYHVIALREKIAGAELSISKDGKRWVVAIIVSGFGQDIKMFFKKQDREKADELFKTILKYLTDGNKD